MTAINHCPLVTRSSLCDPCNRVHYVIHLGDVVIYYLIHLVNVAKFILPYNLFIFMLYYILPINITYEHNYF
jgi:hypothetical protein